jgi:integrative and conjugative element protein (TIGR02256 family)
MLRMGAVRRCPAKTASKSCPPEPTSWLRRTHLPRCGIQPQRNFCPCCADSHSGSLRQTYPWSSALVPGTSQRSRPTSMGCNVPGQAPEVLTPLTIIWLGRGIGAALLMEAARCAPLETGGVLLGWRTTKHICVTNIIGPGPAARHSSTSFNPDAKWQTEQIARLYAVSARRLAYLGDWHTHPGAAPTTSARDRETLQAICQHAPARCPQPIMVILGQPQTDEWVAAGHSVTRDPDRGTLHLTILPLKMDEDLQGFI